MDQAPPDDLYQPLPTNTSIRLLWKFKQTNPTIYCKLCVINLDNMPRYSALSYTWGNPKTGDEPQKNIEDGLVCNDIAVPINENLYQALCNIPTHEDGYLWVDSICINQRDEVDKSSQVAMMGSIYKYAERVFIWLGDEDNDSRTTFHVTRKFNEFTKKWCAIEGCDQLGIEVPYADPAFWKLFGAKPSDEDSVMRFFQRRWFSRAWIIQEVVLANEIQVVCGTDALDWEGLLLLSQLLVDSGWAKKLQAKNVTPTPVGTVPGALQLIRRFCSSGIPVGDEECKTIADVAHKPANIKKEVYYKSLEFLIRFTQGYDASLPEDKIYAPLAIVNCLFSKIIPSPFSVPDYSKPVSRIYTEITGSIISHTQELSLLSTVEEPSIRHRQDLPSWVPDFSVHSISPLIYIREHHFCANREWPTQYQMRISGRKLRTTSIILDSISHFGPPITGLSFPANPTPWVEFLLNMDKTYLNGEPRSDVFVRTLIADQDTDDLVELKERFRVYLLYISAKEYINNWNNHITGASQQDGGPSEAEIRDQMRKAWNRLNGSSPWPLLDKAEAEGESVVIPTWLNLSSFIISSLTEGLKEVEFLEDSVNLISIKLLDAGSYKRLFISTKKYVGFIPLSAEIGDVISFMPGSKVPFLLRRIENGNYRLIGEAYVHGVMYGEMLHNLSIEPETIVLE